MGNKLSTAKKNRINGQIDVSRMKDVNLRNVCFGGSQNQAIGVTEVPEAIVDEFEICWVVKDWSKVSLCSERLQFPEFRGGPLTNHLWSLELEVKNNESIKAFLTLKRINGSSKFIEVNCQLSVNLNDQTCLKSNSPTIIYSYHKMQIGTNFNIMSKRWPTRVQNDTIRINCSVKVKIPFKDLMKHTLMTSQNRPLKTPKTPQALTSSNEALRQDFGSLFHSKEFADFKLVVGNVKIPAHKAILAARSKVFATMLATQMKENAESSVVIEDFGPEVVNAMLEFIYSGKTEVKGVSTEELLLIAEKYQIPELVAECQTVLISQMTVLNAPQFLKLAHLVTSAVELKTSSIQFIKGNIEQVSKTEGYKELVKSYPDLLTEILLLKK